jgi:hypothetical protein
MTLLVFLFIFCFPALIIENCSIKQAVIKGINLFLTKPFLFTGKLIGSALFYGICLVILAACTSSLLALIMGETNLLFNPQLASIYSPWWQQLVINGYAIFGLPLLVITTSILYKDFKNSQSSPYAP